MPSEEIDQYLAELDEPRRATLAALRRSILAVVPDAEEGLSYGMPAFKVGGKAVAGFGAFKRHLSYLPHSGHVLATLADELDGYELSKGALRFPIDTPLPDALVARLVTARLAQLGLAP
ncbi:MAG: iron chaperone [Acidimicrobiia bacterium]